MIWKTRLAATMPRVKVRKRVDARDGIEEETPGDEEGNHGAGEIFPLSAHHAPQATIRMMPDSAMKETAGPDDRLAAHHRHVFSPTLRDALSKVSSAFGFHGVGLDLADAGEVVVEDGVERGGGLG
jgi:hypothetical protein